MILESRVILVTGASSGIGLAALRVFAEAGATVIGVARNPAPAQPEVQRLAGEGYRVHFLDGRRQGRGQRGRRRRADRA